jgi:hypothetical protein
MEDFMKVTDCFEIEIFDKGLLTEPFAMFGTEYEIENIKNTTFNEFLNQHISVVEDHSLRNNGREFITVPSSYKNSIILFNRLHENLKLGPNPYSSRTSTHVHLNILPLELEQLKHLVLLYAFLEPVFFAYAGEKRKQNIHCVPLNYTMLPKYYNIDVNLLVSQWTKYSAFNLCPVKTQGTVEFRHLGGTGDVSYYTGWLTLIRDLYNFVVVNSNDWLEEQLFNNITQREIQMQVLPTSGTLYPLVDDNRASLIDVKLAFV